MACRAASCAPIACSVALAVLDSESSRVADTAAKQSDKNDQRSRRREFRVDAKECSYLRGVAS